MRAQRVRGAAAHCVTRCSRLPSGDISHTLPNGAPTIGAIGRLNRATRIFLRGTEPCSALLRHGYGGYGSIPLTPQGPNDGRDCEEAIPQLIKAYLGDLLYS